MAARKVGRLNGFNIRCDGLFAVRHGDASRVVRHIIRIIIKVADKCTYEIQMNVSTFVANSSLGIITKSKHTITINTNLMYNSASSVANVVVVVVDIVVPQRKDRERFICD